VDGALWVANCTSRSQFNVQTDGWESQGTVPGSTRSNETGRNGYVAIPNDCSWYNEQYVAFYWFPPTPLYVCGWFHVYETGYAVDYVCVRAH